MTPTAQTEENVHSSERVLTAEELRDMDAYWRACNYLCAGMIYLRDNPLLQGAATPRAFQESPARTLGIRPGTNIHLGPPQSRDSQVRPRHDLHFRSGSWRASSASNCYLEGTYSEVYPEKSQDEAGMLRLFRAFSFPGQLGSHCTPEVPGSIHEGGELGYSVSHAFGAAFDNPDLIVSVMVGDGEAETGPLATSWHSNKFLNPIRDGAVLPILHLNGYKIANPTMLARITAEELEAL